MISAVCRVYKDIAVCSKYYPIECSLLQFVMTIQFCKNFTKMACDWLVWQYCRPTEKCDKECLQWNCFGWL